MFRRIPTHQTLHNCLLFNVLLSEAPAKCCNVTIAMSIAEKKRVMWTYCCVLRMLGGHLAPPAAPGVQGRQAVVEDGWMVESSVTTGFLPVSRWRRLVCSSVQRTKRKTEISKTVTTCKCLFQHRSDNQGPLKSRQWSG